MKVSRHIKKKFLAGLLILIPLVVTTYIISVVVGAVDTLISPVIRSLTGKDTYIPGIGILIFFVVVYLAGLLASNYIGKKAILYGEMFLKKIPIVKSIYGSVKDMTDAFSSEKKRSFKKVVLAEFPFQGRYAIGFVVNRLTIQNSRYCSVFIPTTPNPTSGYLIMVPENELAFLTISIDEALKHIVSIGTTTLDLSPGERREPVNMV